MSAGGVCARDGSSNLMLGWEEPVTIRRAPRHAQQ